MEHECRIPIEVAVVCTKRDGGLIESLDRSVKSSKLRAKNVKPVIEDLVVPFDGLFNPASVSINVKKIPFSFTTLISKPLWTSRTR